MGIVGTTLNPEDFTKGYEKWNLKEHEHYCHRQFLDGSQ